MEQVSSIWERVLNIFKERLSTPSFETWLKPTRVRVEDNKWFMITQNEFSRDWIESRYLPEIKEVIYTVTGQCPELEVIAEERNKSSDDRNLYREISRTNLNSNYTFESFIVGKSNRFPYVAAELAATELGKAYNPLFIFGSTGLGKTHLLHAIGNHALKHNSSVNVIYVTAEQFTNEYIESIRCNQSQSFRNKYRQVDVLLVDDIQYFGGKEQAQEELFHTFNSLFLEGKQIVFASNKPAKEIHGIDNHLASRLEWGLTTEVIPIEEDLQRKMIIILCERKNVQMTEKVIRFLEKRTFVNFPEILSAINGIAISQQMEK
ncbi:chromosomal replication initiator protein DnaA [Pueribacillus theae]|uniref:Chromosomal replication initiator protein DnaA n=1 Tax=Pueribacillus theae TaxID=2171751 RepID=A0A2U1K3R5_9BACI|nr:DnaA/Hda family protein [Pueribacillus theae]PWA12180.1 chromosomal replication initiator protein DnaA [Pueribacillus theae]